MGAKEQNPKKWIGLDYHWKVSEDLLMQASQAYVQYLIDYDEHTSRYEAKREYVKRLAEFYGLIVPKPEEPTSIKSEANDE